MTTATGATRQPFSTRAKVAVGLIIVGVLAALLGLMYGANTRPANASGWTSSDYAASQAANRAAAQQAATTKFMIAGLGAVTALAGTIVLVSDRRRPAEL